LPVPSVPTTTPALFTPKAFAVAWPLMFRIWSLCERSGLTAKLWKLPLLSMVNPTAVPELAIPLAFVPAPELVPGDVARARRLDPAVGRGMGNEAEIRAAGLGPQFRLHCEGKPRGLAGEQRVVARIRRGARRDVPGHSPAAARLRGRAGKPTAGCESWKADRRPYPAHARWLSSKVSVQSKPSFARRYRNKCHPENRCFLLRCYRNPVMVFPPRPSSSP
jgi:hypothetical protein